MTIENNESDVKELDLDDEHEWEDDVPGKKLAAVELMERMTRWERVEALQWLRDRFCASCGTDLGPVCMAACVCVRSHQLGRGGQ